MRYRSTLLAVALSVPVFGQTISTIGGTGQPGFSGDGGPAIRALFSDPRSLAVDGSGNVYVEDSNNGRVRRISPAGMVITVAGTGEAGTAVKGPATKSPFLSIYGIAVTENGTLYIADSNGLHKVSPSGALSFVVTGQSVPGIALGPKGLIYLAGITNVSVLNPSGGMKIIAGTELGDSGDGGPAAKAKFFVTQVVTDPAGNLYVVDNEAHRVRKFAPGGVITTFAGNGKPGFGGDGGPADRAQLNRPGGMAIDVAGNAYIADTGNFRVRQVGTDGVIRTIAGNGESTRAGDGGPALRASFESPGHIAVGCSGVYVTDTESIRKITLTAPLIAYNGVADAGGKPSLSAGQRFSVSGCNLAAMPATADSKQPLPATLGGASVTINGVSATLSSVGANQIKGVAPAGIASGQAKVIVSVDGNASNPSTVNIN